MSARCPRNLSPRAPLPLTAALLAGLAALGPQAHAAAAHAATVVAAQPAVHFSFAEGKLSGRASRVPLADALRALQQATGADLVGLRSVQGQEVSFDIAGLPLERALERVLRHRSFVAVLGSGADGERLVRLVLGPGPAEAPLPAARRDPAPSAPAPPSASTQTSLDALHAEVLQGRSPGERLAAIEAMREARADEDPERVASTLEAALAGDPDSLVRQAALQGLRSRGALTVPALLDAASHDADAAVRLAALDALRTHAMEDPRIFEVVGALAGSEADPSVRAAAEALHRDMRDAGARPHQPAGASGTQHRPSSESPRSRSTAAKTSHSSGSTAMSITG